MGGVIQSVDEGQFVKYFLYFYKTVSFKPFILYKNCFSASV